MDIKFERLKSHIRSRQDERREKANFLFAFRSSHSLAEHLREAQEAWDEEETYWLYIPYTEEELAQMEEAKNRPSAEELLAALMEGIEHA